MRITIFIESELKNIARPFNPAIWRKTEINRFYNSVQEAKKYHNLKNCNYQHLADNGKVLKEFHNAKLDAYGNRIK